MKKAVISLEDMEFYAFHGCYDLEQAVGNRFMVALRMEAEVGDAAAADDITRTVNYLSVYNVVRREMAVKSRILENVAERINRAVLEEFPQVGWIEVKVSKMAPPLGGKVGRVSVTMCKSKE